MASTRSHWEGVYGTRGETDVSWYQPHSLRSLTMIAAAAPDHGASIVDIGGGASRLVDDLLARGYTDVSVLDVSDTALAMSKARLGTAARSFTHMRAGELGKRHRIGIDRGVYGSAFATA